MRVGCSYGPQNPCHTLIPVELHQVLWYLKSMHYTHISLQDVRLHNCPSYFICIQKWRWQWHKCWIYLLHSQRTLNSFLFFCLFLFSHSVGGEKEKRSSPVSSESYSNLWRTQNIVLHYSTADERMCLIAKPSLFNILTFFPELLTDCSFVIQSTILSGSLEATVALWSKWTCQNKHCYKSKDFHFHFSALLLIISHSTQASCF